MTTITTPPNSYAQYYTKYYTHGNYEEKRDLNADEVVSRDCYIFAGDGLAAIYRSSDATGDAMYYVHKDHLGSLDVITNESGTIVDKYAFDAWGNRRMHDNWTQADNTPHLFDRGFTGHSLSRISNGKHLDKFGLINMNGRLYDPVVARFLSPDPFIQAPNNSQNLNRYSYCLNNPLRYTDPSGYLTIFGLDIDFDWGSANMFGQIFGAFSGMLSGIFGTIFGFGEEGGHATSCATIPSSNLHGGGGSGGSSVGGYSGGGSGVGIGSGSFIGVGLGFSGVSILNGGGNEKKDGGFFNTKKELLTFMMHNSFEIDGVEIGGFKLRDRNTDEIIYFVDPWVQNDERKTRWQYRFGQDQYDIVERYHTHPLGGEASYDDYISASSSGRPDFVIRRNDVLGVYRWPDYASGKMPPLRRGRTPYSDSWYSIYDFLNN